MAIEIKELIIKTTVTQENMPARKEQKVSKLELAILKKDLENMCRDIVEEYLQKKTRR